MTLTEEQLKMIGESYLDDLPFYYGDVDQSKLWNSLPVDIQTEGLKWGANDTVVRELVGEHLLKTQLDLTFDLWYDKDDSGIHTHELAEAMFNNNEPIWVDIDYTKL